MSFYMNEEKSKNFDQEILKVLKAQSRQLDARQVKELVSKEILKQYGGENYYREDIESVVKNSLSRLVDQKLVFNPNKDSMWDAGIYRVSHPRDYLISPKRGEVYKLKDIMLGMYLRDSPFLNFKHDGVKYVMQDGPFSDKELLAIPGMADSLWEYEYETDEWCPIFHYRGTQPITELVEFTVRHEELTAYPIGSAAKEKQI